MMNIVTPETVGLASKRLQHIRTVTQRYVDKGKFSGIVTLIARRGGVAHCECVGMMED